MFKVKIIGTGSKGNCMLISDGATGVLVDAGVNPLKTLLDSVQLSDFEAVLLTHEHGDHAKFAEMWSKCYNRRLYATQGTHRALFTSGYNWSAVEVNVPFDMYGLRIMPFAVPHDAAEPCGYYIKNALGETLCVIPDCGSLDNIDITADTFLIEANYDEETLEQRLDDGELYSGLHARLTSEFGHLSIQQTAHWLNNDNRRQANIIITHMSHDNAIDTEAFKVFENVWFARNGSEYTFGQIRPF